MAACRLRSNVNAFNDLLEDTRNVRLKSPRNTREHAPLANVSRRTADQAYSPTAPAQAHMELDPESNARLAALEVPPLLSPPNEQGMPIPQD